MLKMDRRISANDVQKDSSKFCENFAAEYVPITRWLPKYTKFQALSDFVAGITLGLTMIPQSIAYAAIAGLTPQYGLYSAFLGGFIYLFFGSVKEVSIGPTSLMALLTLEFTRDMPHDFMILLGFLAGCAELSMGLLNLGFLVDFISIPVTAGFTSATAVILIVHQLPHLLGIEYEAVAVIDSIVKLSQNISNIRFSDTALGLTSVVLLLSMRKLKDIKIQTSKDGKKIIKGTLMMKILWFFTTGRNVIVVLTSTVVAYHLSTTGQKPFLLSGNVTSGLPSFTLPNFSTQVGNQTYTFVEMCTHLGLGMITVPLVAVLTNVAIAKAFSTGDLVDASQEMRTLGICNVLGSFISSMPTCGSFTRSALSSASGVQTPMAGIYSGTLTLLALSFLTPYFHYIPQATLAAVLISAIVFMIDLRMIPVLWKGNKSDAAACLITFITCVTVNVKTGLLLGTICNIIHVLFLSARPNIAVTECKTNQGEKYMLLKPKNGLLFLDVNFLTQKILKIADEHNDKDVPIIIDCQTFNKVDYTAIKGIERLQREFEKKDQRLRFSNVSPSLRKSIRMMGNIESLQILETDENMIECSQDLGKETDPENNLTVKDVSKVPKMIKRGAIQVKINPREEKNDTENEKDTLVPEERLSLMVEHRAEILTRDPPLLCVHTQEAKNVKELGLP